MPFKRAYTTLATGAIALHLLIASTTQAEEVVKWVDEKGHVHFGDQPPKGSNTKTEVIQVQEALKLGLSAEELAQQKRKTQAYKRELESRNLEEKEERQENSTQANPNSRKKTKTREDCRNDNKSKTADRVRCFRSLDDGPS